MKVIIASLLLACIGCDNATDEVHIPKKKYTADWDSLAQHTAAPQWFKDAKFGIFVHWGLMSVPEFDNDWYPRNMFVRGSRAYKHQVDTYGAMNSFAYHNFAPLFTAEKFDAEAWASLFKASGAQFAGIVAEHHDGWSNWDSKINPWNAKDMGPQLDIMGVLSKAIREKDLKFVATFHKARNLQLFQNDPSNWKNDMSYFPYNPNYATSSKDSLIRILYGNIPREQFYKNWLGELKEVVDNYTPDMLYFDGMLKKIPDSYKKDFLAYYFTQASYNNQEVVVTHRMDELPKSMSVEALEKGRSNAIQKDTWLGDETIAQGSWTYTPTLNLKTSQSVLDILIDVISKNGIFMFNISPRANGEIPKDQQEILLEVGQWLNEYAQSIYGTRPWEFYSENDAEGKLQSMFLKAPKFGVTDVRYTKKDKEIYAFLMRGYPKNEEIILTHFSSDDAIQEITCLDTEKKLTFHFEKDGMHVSGFPNQKQTKIMTKVLKIVLK